MNSKTGKFIVVEGIDGSGKSTQIKNIEKYFTGKGQQVYATFEPTDGPVGSLIRQMLEGKVPVDQRTIASLFAADRTDHLCNSKNGIAKMVEKGTIVLCDRYYFSSYAYHAQYIDMDWVIHANSLNAQILRPALTIFLDVRPETCFDRIKKNRDRFDMYEKMDIMKKVRENYFIAFDRLKEEEKVVVVDANKDLEDVENQVLEVIREHLNL